MHREIGEFYHLVRPAPGAPLNRVQATQCCCGDDKSPRPFRADGAGAGQDAVVVWLGPASGA